MTDIRLFSMMRGNTMLGFVSTVRSLLLTRFLTVITLNFGLPVAVSNLVFTLE